MQFKIEVRPEEDPNKSLTSEDYTQRLIQLALIQFRIILIGICVVEKS